MLLLPEKINRPLKVYFVQGEEVTFRSAFDFWTKRRVNFPRSSLVEDTRYRRLANLYYEDLVKR